MTGSDYKLVYHDQMILICVLMIIGTIYGKFSLVIYGKLNLRRARAIAFATLTNVEHEVINEPHQMRKRCIHAKTK